MRNYALEMADVRRIIGAFCGRKIHFYAFKLGVLADCVSQSSYFARRRIARSSLSKKTLSELFIDIGCVRSLSVKSAAYRSALLSPYSLHVTLLISASLFTSLGSPTEVWCFTERTVYLSIFHHFVYNTHKALLIAPSSWLPATLSLSYCSAAVLCQVWQHSNRTTKCKLFHGGSGISVFHLLYSSSVQLLQQHVWYTRSDLSATSFAWV